MAIPLRSSAKPEPAELPRNSTGCMLETSCAYWEAVLESGSCDTADALCCAPSLVWSVMCDVDSLPPTISMMACTNPQLLLKGNAV